MANRIWQHHFGRGLLPTPSDFGRQGQPVSHPELLDFLARRFVESGWSIKAMHRLLLSSRTYQLASREHGDTTDPGNTLYGHFSRRRLDAEAIRDSLLAVSDRLERTRGGAHPFPDQRRWDFTQHNPFKAVYETNQRSVYLMAQRIQRHPFLAIFDGPDTNSSTAQRAISTSPLQALYFLNDAFFHEQAGHFADRVIAGQVDGTSRLEYAYLLALGRPPDTAELEHAEAFLICVRAVLQAEGIDAAQIERQAWHSFARVLLRTNEFVYVQ
jgi:hypothetical protein